MGTIVTIGGGFGEFSRAPKIDNKIVELSGKQKPKLLFIGTASRDSDAYFGDISDNFSKLGAEVSVLNLVSETPTLEVVKDKIASSDIIYVGGGDTRFMINHWKQFNIREQLIEAYHRGSILCGLSAGSICWYEWGNSDSESFVADGEWSFIKTPGMGIIEMAHCPHYDEPGRHSFDDMMNEENVLDGLALENGTAMLVQNGIGCILFENEACNAYLFKNIDGSSQRTKLNKNYRFDVKINV